MRNTNTNLCTGQSDKVSIHAISPRFNAQALWGKLWDTQSGLSNNVIVSTRYLKKWWSQAGSNR